MRTLFSLALISSLGLIGTSSVAQTLNNLPAPLHRTVVDEPRTPDQFLGFSMASSEVGICIFLGHKSGVPGSAKTWRAMQMTDGLNGTRLHVGPLKERSIEVDESGMVIRKTYRKKRELVGQLVCLD